MKADAVNGLNIGHLAAQKPSSYRKIHLQVFDLNDSVIVGRMLRHVFLSFQGLSPYVD
jgi:hypothetical protein